MPIHKIPINKISPEALQGVIEESITRSGIASEVEAAPILTCPLAWVSLP